MQKHYIFIEKKGKRTVYDSYLCMAEGPLGCLDFRERPSGWKSDLPSTTLYLDPIIIIIIIKFFKKMKPKLDPRI